MNLTAEQITALFGLIVALTALAGAITNRLNHQANKKKIAQLHAKVDHALAKPGQKPPPK